MVLKSKGKEEYIVINSNDEVMRFREVECNNTQLNDILRKNVQETNDNKSLTEFIKGIATAGVALFFSIGVIKVLNTLASLLGSSIMIPSIISNVLALSSLGLMGVFLITANVDLLRKVLKDRNKSDVKCLEPVKEEDNVIEI